jgi:hypothetical protein
MVCISHLPHNSYVYSLFALHFLIHFVIAAIVLVHLLYLHQTGSNIPLGLNKKCRQNSIPPLLYSKGYLGIRNHYHNTNSINSERTIHLEKSRQLHPSKFPSNTSTCSKRMVENSLQLTCTAFQEVFKCRGSTACVSCINVIFRIINTVHCENHVVWGKMHSYVNSRGCLEFETAPNYRH